MKFFPRPLKITKKNPSKITRRDKSRRTGGYYRGALADKFTEDDFTTHLAASSDLEWVEAEAGAVLVYADGH